MIFLPMNGDCLIIGGDKLPPITRPRGTGIGLCESAQTRLGHSALYESTTGAHKTEEREIL
jgi:hypothetical protein